MEEFSEYHLENRLFQFFLKKVKYYRKMLGENYDRSRFTISIKPRA